MELYSDGIHTEDSTRLLLLDSIHYNNIYKYWIVLYEIPYSRKFSYGANFRIFTVHMKLKIAKF